MSTSISDLLALKEQFVKKIKAIDDVLEILEMNNKDPHNKLDSDRNFLSQPIEKQYDILRQAVTRAKPEFSTRDVFDIVTNTFGWNAAYAHVSLKIKKLIANKEIVSLGKKSNKSGEKFKIGDWRDVI